MNETKLDEEARSIPTKCSGHNFLLVAQEVANRTGKTVVVLRLNNLNTTQSFMVVAVGQAFSVGPATLVHVVEPCDPFSD